MSSMSNINSLRVMEMYICFNIKIQAQFRIWLMTRISIKMFSLTLGGAIYLKTAFIFVK